MILLFGFQVCTLHRLSSLKSYMLTRQCIWLDGLDALGSGFQGMYLWQELHYSSLFSWLQVRSLSLYQIVSMVPLGLRRVDELAPVSGGRSPGPCC